MREDIINPDFPAAQTGENRDEPSLSPPAAGKENIETHSTLLPTSGENAGAPLDHWEQEKAKLSLALTERLLRGRDLIAFSELKASLLLRHERLLGLGEIVLAFLRRQAREIIRQEKPLLLQSKRRFDLDDDELRTELRQLRDLLAERLVFDKNELHAALAFGVRLLFDVITKPAAALERLIYPRGIEQKKADVAVILQGFEKNHPLAVHLLRELAAHSGDLITKAVFSACCRRAEKEIYGRRLVSPFVAELQTCQNFCAAIGPASYHRLETQTVVAMLRERGLQDLAERLSPDLTEQKSWSIPEIERLLEERESATAPFSPPPVMSRPVGTSTVQFSSRPQAHPALLENERRETGVGERSWPQVEAQGDLNLAPEETARNWALPQAPVSANEKEMEIPAAAEATPLDATAGEAQGGEPVILSPAGTLSDIEVEPAPEIDAPRLAARPKVVYYDEDGDEPQLIERVKIEAQPPGPYPSITRLVDEKSRRDFIRKIFHKDLEAYLAFIERIEAMETWKEAKAFLDHELQQRKVNPYTKEAVRLSDVVFSRYFARGASGLSR
jgi:hypothetical protein